MVPQRRVCKPELAVDGHAQDSAVRRHRHGVSTALGRLMSSSRVRGTGRRYRVVVDLVLGKVCGNGPVLHDGDSAGRGVSIHGVDRRARLEVRGVAVEEVSDHPFRAALGQVSDSARDGSDLVAQVIARQGWSTVQVADELLSAELDERHVVHHHDLPAGVGLGWRAAASGCGGRCAGRRARLVDRYRCVWPLVRPVHGAGPGHEAGRDQA